MKVPKCLVALLLITVAGQFVICTGYVRQQPLYSTFKGDCAKSALSELLKKFPKDGYNMMNQKDCSKYYDDMITFHELTMKWTQQCKVQIPRITGLGYGFLGFITSSFTCNYEGDKVLPFLSKAEDFCNKQSKVHGANNECKEIYAFNRCMSSFSHFRGANHKVGEKSRPFSILSKKVPLTCAAQNRDCHAVALKKANNISAACYAKVKKAEEIRELQTFRCNEGAIQFTKYDECSQIFNDPIRKMNNNFECLTPIMHQRSLNKQQIYNFTTYECSFGLKGWWNRGKFGNKKELTPAEKSEEKVMIETNNCLGPFADRTDRRGEDQRQREDKLWKIKPSVSYTLCIQKILLKVVEEEEKLKQSVQFYPNFPNNIESEYNVTADKEKYKQVVLSSLIHFESECKRLSIAASKDNCEQAKSYNRCITRANEASKFWNKIDSSISAQLNTMDEEKECQSSTTEEAD